ncbi:hypothetical protein COT97_00530 [Candidatus Falkowbacteria bacterium CG10_big_fil_rev_8_21_14_0_10_39_11]|uniref:Uncharacterized protein n=1 Tax=Candidatus Falkowbacteria bacterium CG10_big_fil_rev_8_21_14_0_10_39_11 TaxID=1974565 RepID=A0A2H0V6C4_9BACT|nr:MAG: hypothetical protein COT97_00530 [Candidatus Falkowbacteria bacterium CG10_big_fil_rev_8_21_14_0_10_39_11]
MKKAIQILLITILVIIVAIIVVFAFDIFDYRTKFISKTVNTFLSKNIEDYTPLDQLEKSDGTIPESNDLHPLLNSEQEKTLTELGVNVSQLPTELTADDQECLVEVLGQTRFQELYNGATPGAVDLIKAKKCF